MGAEGYFLQPVAARRPRVARAVFALLLAIIAFVSAAPTAANQDQLETVALRGESVIDVEFSAAPGVWVLEGRERFATVKLTVADAATGKETVLNSADPGSGIIVLPVTATEQTRIAVRVDVLATVSQRATLDLNFSPLAEPQDSATYRALALQADLSQLPADRSDEDLAKGLALASAAAQLWRRGDDNVRSAEMLLIAAQFARLLEQYDEATAFAVEAQSLFAAEQDANGTGRALTVLGLTQINLRQFDAAEENLQQAKALLRDTYHPHAVSPAATNLCYLQLERRAFGDAERCFLELIPLAERAQNYASVARMYSNLGGIYGRRRLPAESIRYLERSLSTPGVRTSTRTRARRLNNIGTQYRSLGDIQQALENYQESLRLHRGNSDRSQIARVLANIGVAYGSIGVPRQALVLFEEALATIDGANDRARLRLFTLQASAYAYLGDSAAALEILNEALTLSEQVNDELRRLQLLNRIAMTNHSNGNVAESLEGFKSLLNELTGVNDDPSLLSQVLYNYASVLLANGDLDQAERLGMRSLSLRKGIGNSIQTAEAHSLVSRVHWRKGNARSALDAANEAIEMIEQSRAVIDSIALRASYQSTVSDAYELAIYVLMADDRIADGLAMAERYRAQTLVDVLAKSDSGTNASIPLELLERRDTLRKEINRRETRRIGGEATESIAGLLAELDTLDARIASLDPRFAAAGEGRIASVTEMQSVMDQDSIAIQYFLGRERSYAWLITQDSISAKELPARDGIEDQVREIHDRLSRRTRTGELTNTLGEALLGPIADKLPAYRNVAIVADGALHYLPFDVLVSSDAANPTLSGKSLSYLPSLTTLALIRQSSTTDGNRQIAVLADPVFNASDERMSASVSAQPGSARGAQVNKLNRLAMSGLEAAAIRELAPERARFVRTGTDANIEALRSDAVAAAQVVHIAAHGFVDDEMPARTGLALSMLDDTGDTVTGFVGLRDIYELRLNAELVVLSACDTALGRDLAGEGLLGLTRGFMYAGAKRVVASLWQVEDAATAALMQAFYTGMLRDGLAPAAALAAAKAQLQQTRRWRHPYYWSGFVLLGDWRELN
ncbi:MAG: CHAT domain-containing protein [Pseudomonadota bacterium]